MPSDSQTYPKWNIFLFKGSFETYFCKTTLAISLHNSIQRGLSDISQQWKKPGKKKDLLAYNLSSVSQANPRIFSLCWTCLTSVNNSISWAFVACFGREVSTSSQLYANRGQQFAVVNLWLETRPKCSIYSLQPLLLLSLSFSFPANTYKAQKR